MRILIVIAAAAVVALLVRFCGADDTRIGAQATSPAQTELWDEVNRRGVPPGVQRVPPANPAVQPRPQPPRPPTQQIAPGPGLLAPAVTTGVRLVSVPNGGEWTYSGKAVVVDVDDTGERIRLRADPKAEVSLIARLDSKPLGLVREETVDLFVDSTASVFDRKEIFALRTPTGAEIVTVVQTGSVPVVLSAQLPSFTLSVRQADRPVNGTAVVDIEIGGGKDELSRTAPVKTIGGYSVRLLGSAAQPAGRGDISPYGISLVAWRAGKTR